MNEFGNFKKPNKSENNPKEITLSDFSERLNDLSNQLLAANILMQGSLSFEKIKEQIKENQYFTFEETLDNFNQKLSKEISSNGKYMEAIKTYNDIIQKLKDQDFNSKDDLKKIIEEARKIRNLYKEKEFTAGEKIENENQFWLSVKDAKNQFGAMRLLADELTDEELIKYSRKRKYLTFLDYLKSHDINVSENILNTKEAKFAITMYDKIVSRMEVFDSREEFNRIMRDLDKDIDRYSGLSKDE